MAEPSKQLDGLAAEPPPADRPIKCCWQVGMRTLILLICAVAAWLGLMMNRERTRVLQARLDVTRSLVRELEVDDPGQIAVVKKLDQWLDEDCWDLYLPPGFYRICMATRQVGNDGLPPAMKWAPIRPGRHHLALEERTEENSWKGVLICDGSEHLVIEEPKTFPGDHTSTSEVISVSDQIPANLPVVLSRSQFSNSSAGGGSVAPTAVSDGLMIWIEPDPAATPAR
jgi:hypothetical protein